MIATGIIHLGNFIAFVQILGIPAPVTETECAETGLILSLLYHEQSMCQDTHFMASWPTPLQSACHAGSGRGRKKPTVGRDDDPREVVSTTNSRFFRRPTVGSILTPSESSSGRAIFAREERLIPAHSDPPLKPSPKSSGSVLDELAPYGEFAPNSLPYYR